MIREKASEKDLTKIKISLKSHSISKNYLNCPEDILTEIIFYRFVQI